MGLIKDGDSSVPQGNRVPIGEPAKTYQPSDNRSRQIQAQGTIQAAMQSQALLTFCTNEEEWWAKVEWAAKKAIKFIQENS
jgi:hypothetical protein